MPADPEERTPELWHEALRARDLQQHEDEDARTVLSAVEALESRLRQANADRHTLGAAVATRDALLAELSHALRERDASVGALEADLAHLRALGEQPLLPRVARRVRRDLGRALGRHA
jgi:septal ring factor EnvC (AmiA/AmiB activator)